VRTIQAQSFRESSCRGFLMRLLRQGGLLPGCLQVQSISGTSPSHFPSLIENLRLLPRLICPPGVSFRLPCLAVGFGVAVYGVCALVVATRLGIAQVNQARKRITLSAKASPLLRRDTRRWSLYSVYSVRFWRLALSFAGIAHNAAFAAENHCVLAFI
jgi:hypothetical protein